MGWKGEGEAVGTTSDHDKPLTVLWHSVVGGVHHLPAQIVAAAREGVADLSPRPPPVRTWQAVHVLEDKDLWPQLVQDAAVGLEELPAFVLGADDPASAAACRRECLTRRSADHASDACIPVLAGVELANVDLVYDGGTSKPVITADVRSKRFAVAMLDLDASDDIVAGLQEAYVEATSPRKQAERRNTVRRVGHRMGIGFHVDFFPSRSRQLKGVPIYCCG